MVVFVILVVASRSLGYLRSRRLSVADSEVSAGNDVRRAAALGAGSGLLVLLLIAVLYTGISRWDWLGHPAVSHSAVASPMPISSPAPGEGPGISGSPPAGSPPASQSTSPTP
jgi:hypothetical protein